MALYPSLEDLEVDQLAKAQREGSLQYDSNFSKNLSQPIIPSAPRLSTLLDSDFCAKYPSLNEYMGLELTPDVIAANMPEYLEQSKCMTLTSRGDYSVQQHNTLGNLVAPLSGDSLGLQKAHVTNGIRQVILCKDADGKVGIRVQSINNGIFINLVTKSSPAAMAGLRFGDQILGINGKSVAGLTMESVHELIKKSPANGIIFFVRDRPFERTVTLHKDSAGYIGFSFKDGKIINLVVDSSAAKNGLLTEHQLLEINGQNVVGLKDKEITKIISEGGDIITVTVIPTFIYQHMTKRMSTNLLKSFMDHSTPSF